MTLRRLDAIATGMLSLAAGAITIAMVWPSFYETWQQALRQRQTLGTTVAVEATPICRQTQRRNLFQCTRWVKEFCPVVQYQPVELSQPLKLKDCSQRARVGMVFAVVYDRQAPIKARLVGQADGLTDWIPRFWTSLLLGVGVLLVGLGGYKLWQGIRDRPPLD